jgi:hypothetical protein
VRTFEIEERRARLGVRHHLARQVGPVEGVASDLVGLHSSDPATVFLSARARVDGFDPAHLEDALYRRRSVVRVLGMRRTLFVVPTALVDVIDAACTKALVQAQRRACSPNRRPPRTPRHGSMTSRPAPWKHS